MNPIEVVSRPISEPPVAMSAEPAGEQLAAKSAAVATPRQLMWWKFSRHRIAVISAVVLIIFYVVALLADFLSPYDPNTTTATYKLVPPQGFSFVDGNDSVVIPPVVFALKSVRNPETLRITYEIDRTKWYPVQFFAQGERYRLLGLIETNIHFIGLGRPAAEAPWFLLGSDRLGRDVFSRMLYGARISLSIGLVAVFLSLVLGIILGGISGYYGGWVDLVIQRVIELIRSVPSLPLWMGLSAALPPEWPQEWRYFGITIILSLIGWTTLARQVRGKFLSLRSEDFVLAARFSGAPEWRIITRHMVPSFTSHIIASLTLSIPGIILAETALSFLGLGLRQPVISWGVLLQEAQNVRTVALAPWLLWPAAAIILTVLAYNFLGDGLRDAADPFNR
jgi:peptide/nickel transport system permease protein